MDSLNRETTKARALIGQPISKIKNDQLAMKQRINVIRAEWVIIEFLCLWILCISLFPHAKKSVESFSWAIDAHP